jgi:hypothetical protein
MVDSENLDADFADQRSMPKIHQQAKKKGLPKSFIFEGADLPRTERPEAC